mmetsp:Transcript_17113/g.54409  ORF Transcript_17113/g.54409 Transcript_17113/m.54409 type:complete len:320 (-) Transcript_17113:124-1083(-)
MRAASNGGEKLWPTRPVVAAAAMAPIKPSRNGLTLSKSSEFNFASSSAIITRAACGLAPSILEMRLKRSAPRLPIALEMSVRTEAACPIVTSRSSRTSAEGGSRAAFSADMLCSPSSSPSLSLSVSVSSAGWKGMSFFLERELVGRAPALPTDALTLRGRLARLFSLAPNVGRLRLGAWPLAPSRGTLAETASSTSVKSTTSKDEGLRAGGGGTACAGAACAAPDEFLSECGGCSSRGSLAPELAARDSLGAGAQPGWLGESAFDGAVSELLAAVVVPHVCSSTAARMGTLTKGSCSCLSAGYGAKVFDWRSSPLLAPA